MPNAPITQLLQHVRAGDPSSHAQLLPLIYEELRHIAHRQLSNERANTLMTTDLVHEAWLRLVDAPLHSLNDRLHFFAVASRAMRQVLVDAARRRKAGKRGGAYQASMPIEEAADWLSEQKSVALLALHEALDQLQVMDERMARIVELRYFGGLTIAETAKLLEISDSTVKRDWETAKVWLFSELKGIPLDL